MELLKRNAKDELVKIADEFLNLVEVASAKVFINGNEKQLVKFLNLLEKDNSVIVAPNLYIELANRIAPTLGQDKWFSPSTWTRTQEVIKEYAHHLNVYPTKLPEEPNNISVNQFEGLVDVVRNVVRGAFEDRLNRRYLLENIAKKALELEEVKSVIFVVIHSTENKEKEQLAEMLFNKQPNYTVTFKENEEVKEEVIKDLVKKAKAFVKTNQKENTNE